MSFYEFFYGEGREAYQQALYRYSVDVSFSSSLDDDWEHTKDAFHSASKETLGKRPKKACDKRLSTETMSLISKRNQIKRLKPSKANLVLYSQVNKKVKKSVRKDDEKWVSQIADRLQYASNVGN